jgi:Tfp pilus assembly PilM family ATPase
MIKNIFVPEKVGSRRLFGKRIVGIDLQSAAVQVTQIYLSGSSITIEKVFSVPIPAGADKKEQIKEALDAVQKQIPANAEIRTNISSGLAVFKSISFPFSDHQKIALVIGYELESLLPFARSDAIIDFVITSVLPNGQGAQVMAACIQKNYILDHLALYAQSNINPTAITFDIIAMYGLYELVYKQPETVLLIDFGMQSTKIAYLYNGQLRAIRVLATGLSQIVKAAADQLSMSWQDAHDQLMHAGWQVSGNQVVDACKTASGPLINNLLLTIQSCLSGQEVPKVAQLILYGTAQLIPETATFLQEQLHMTCTPFDTTLLLHRSGITSQISSLNPDALVSVATALSATTQEAFNLRQGEFAPKDVSLVVKQLAVGIFLFFAFWGVLLVHYFWQTHALANEIKSSTAEVISVLKEQFKLGKDETDLQEIIELAEQEITKERETWFAFSYANQSRFLQYLLELTNKIDKASLGFVPEKITIIEGTLTLKARVKDYDALKLLEKELRSSKLFATVEPQDTPQFTMKISLAPTTQELL